MTITSRSRLALRAAVLVVLLGAAPAAVGQTATGAAAAQGRLTTRRTAPKAVREQPPAGLRALDLDSSRTVLIYVPSKYRADRPAPLLVMLHGAGGSPQGGLRWVMSLADSAGLLLVAPKSFGMTWDVIRGRYGADVGLIDRAVAHVLVNYAVDTTRLAIGGFSDGATYALSLGITNGDFFSHVVAFSPGFMVPAAQRGEPRLFVSHGTQDRILSIDACSRRIVRRVKDAGYDVVYREFEGGHTVPPEVARAALAWLTAGREARSDR